MSIKLSKKIINNSIKQFFLFMISFILFWFYIYRFKLVGFPISTSQFLMLLGSIFLLIKTHNKKRIIFDYGIAIFIIGLIIPIFFIGLTSVINAQSDFSILTYLMSIPYSLLAFYCFKFYKKEIHQKITFNDIALLFILTGVIQSFLSLIGFIIPDFGHFLIDIQAYGRETGKELAENQFSRRLIGLGAMYFGGGIIYAIDLILITQLMLDKTLYKNKIYKFLPFFYLIIFACGMMMARTTIVGLFFSSLLLLNNSYRKILHIIKTGLPAILMIIIMSSILFFNYGDRAWKLYYFAFEMFINLSSGKGFQTGSSNTTLKMIKFPDSNNFKSWIIGDALFSTPDGHYYMYTDVGFCRSIFYFGIIGSLTLLITQSLMLLYVMKKLDKKYRYFLFILWLMFLTLNIKGFVLIHMYLIPFYFIDKQNNICPTTEGARRYA